MSSDKIIVLRIGQHGLEIVSDMTATPPTEPVAPKETDVKEPRWPHWHQRKLARIWNAALLSLNVEPTIAARKALKQFHPERYQEYQDRLDIAKTLAGTEDLTLYEDHIREGDTPGEKYVSLTDFYAFAKERNWASLETMRIGLRLDTDPPTPFRQNQKNNYLVLMNEVLTLLPGFLESEPEDKAAVIHKWLTTKGMRIPTDLRTIKTWMPEMLSALQAFDARQVQQKDRNILVRESGSPQE